jgi:hypothetical protein
MKYLLLIYDREATWEAMDEAQSGALFQEYMAFTEQLRASGKLLAGEALQPVATATTVRVRDGRLTTTDGPFAETKEQFGGFYMVEAANLDEAIALAGRIPSARLGCVEVRPVQAFD